MNGAALPPISSIQKICLTGKYLHPLLIDDVFCDLGEDGAVPNFLPIGHGKHILLLFSHKRAARYYIGEYGPWGHTDSLQNITVELTMVPLAADMSPVHPQR